MMQKILLNGSELKILGGINLNRIESWLIVKESSHWIAVNFINNENIIMRSRNFSCGFKIKLSKDLAIVTFSLLDSEGKLIKFSDIDQNV